MAFAEMTVIEMLAISFKLALSGRMSPKFGVGLKVRASDSLASLILGNCDLRTPQLGAKYNAHHLIQASFHISDF
jgi:hypothetical protein